MSKTMKIVVDTREKTPWGFNSYGNIRVVSKALKTGDYSVEGSEKKICIERKRSTGEISINMGKKFKQFKAEFERMEAYEKRVLICEFPIFDFDKFPERSGIPKRIWPKLKMKGRTLKSRFIHLCQIHEVELFFCRDEYEAEAKAVEIFKQWYNSNEVS